MIWILAQVNFGTVAIINDLHGFFRSNFFSCCRYGCLREIFGFLGDCSQGRRWADGLYLGYEEQKIRFSSLGSLQAAYRQLFPLRLETAGSITRFSSQLSLNILLANVHPKVSIYSLSPYVCFLADSLLLSLLVNYRLNSGRGKGREKLFRGRGLRRSRVLVQGRNSLKGVGCSLWEWELMRRAGRLGKKSEGSLLRLRRMLWVSLEGPLAVFCRRRSSKGSSSDRSIGIITLILLHFCVPALLFYTPIPLTPRLTS